MTKADKKPSALSAAVQALEGELGRFAELAAGAARVPLTSERNLERAMRSLGEAMESQHRVGQHLQALIQAIAGAREEHDRTAQVMLEQRRVLDERAGVLQTLHQRFGILGQEAAEISERVKQVGTVKEGERPPTTELLTVLTGIAERMQQVIDASTELEKDAREAGFGDLERECDSLRQQMQSAHNKVSLVHQKLSLTIS